MKNARVYIAGPWADRGSMEVVARRLETAGHRITHRWWLTEDGSDPTYLRECAINDIQGVLQADVVLLINSSKSEGKAVEQGIAIAAGTPIVAVGELGATSKNVFQYLDNYTWTRTVSEALEVLNGLVG